MPAVKDATTEQLEARNNALKMLLERTVRSKLSFKEPLDRLRAETEGKYREILKEHQSTLESLSESLSAKLKDWAHPDTNLKVQWHDEASEYVNVSEPLAQVVAGEGRFEGNVYEDKGSRHNKLPNPSFTSTHPKHDIWPQFSKNSALQTLRS